MENVSSLTVTLLGMGTVFVVLIFMSFMIYLLRFLNFNKETKKTSEKNETESLKNASLEEDEDEIIAVISAAIYAVYKRKFKILNIEKIDEDKLKLEKNMNMWAKYGRMQIMTTHANFGKGRLTTWKK